MKLTKITGVQPEHNCHLFCLGDSIKFASRRLPTTHIFTFVYAWIFLNMQNRNFWCGDQWKQSLNGPGAKAELVGLRGFVVWVFCCCSMLFLLLFQGCFFSVNELKTQVDSGTLCHKLL